MTGITHLNGPFPPKQNPVPFVPTPIAPAPEIAARCRTGTTSKNKRDATKGVPKRYSSMCGFISHTLREAGPKGLFRGATPTLAMITPQMGVSFAVWEALKGSPPAFATADGAGAGTAGGAPGTAATVVWQLGAGAIAGMTGKLVAFPLDTVKKRVQTAVRQRGEGGGELQRAGTCLLFGLGAQ